MTPNKLASALREIAAKIDNSKQPSKLLVFKDLNTIIAALDDAMKNHADPASARREEELNKKREQEVEKTLKKTQEDIEKGVKKLVEEGFKNLKT